MSNKLKLKPEINIHEACKTIAKQSITLIDLAEKADRGDQYKAGDDLVSLANRIQVELDRVKKATRIIQNNLRARATKMRQVDEEGEPITNSVNL